MSVFWLRACAEMYSYGVGLRTGRRTGGELAMGISAVWGRLEARFSGSRAFRVPLLGWRVTIYGFNAMHVAINVRTKRWGTFCFHPPMFCFGRWWPWKFYVSMCATPWAAYRVLGPGIEADDREAASRRRQTGLCQCRGSREAGTVCWCCGYPVG